MKRREITAFFTRDGGFELGEYVGVFCRDRERADRASRCVFCDQLAGIGNGFALKIAAHDFIDDAHLRQPRGLHRLAFDDRFQRCPGADQARQALGATGPGKQPEVDLRQTHLRRIQRQSIITAERDLHAAAERGAVDRGDHRFAAGFDRVDDLGQRRRLRRLAELADIGACRKGTTAAHDHQRLRRRVGQAFVQGLEQALANRMAQCVDRRIVDHDQADLILAPIGNDIAHENSLLNAPRKPCRNRSSSPTRSLAIPLPAGAAT